MGRTRPLLIVCSYYNSKLVDRVNCLPVGMNPYYTPTTTINPMSLHSPTNNTPATAIPKSPVVPTSFATGSLPTPTTTTQTKPSKKGGSGEVSSPLSSKKEDPRREVEGTFVCVCGKRYASLNALKNHAKLHTVRERNFVCETCKKVSLPKYLCSFARHF